MSDARNWSEVMAALGQLQKRVETLEKIERTISATGTYTPTYLGGTTPGVTTYSVQYGAYTRFGNIVFFTATVVWTAATGTGDANISIPFTARNASANEAFAMPVRTVSVTFANGSVQGQITDNTAFFFMLSPATNAAGTNVAIEAAGNIVASGWYFV